MPYYFFVITLIGLLLNSACSVEVKKVPIPVELPKRFSKTGSILLAKKWWQIFNDTALNQLIEQALSNNFSLRSTFNRVEQARAVAKKSGASLTPAINLQVNGLRKLTDKLNSNGFSLGLMASYEVDLWGRIRANLQAAELDFYSAEEDLHTAAISLSAEIANSWYRLIEQRLQLQLLEQQISTNSRYNEILELRFRASQATAADVFQQRQLLENITGNKTKVIATIAVLKHQLALLLGQSTLTMTEPIPDSFPQLPALPQTGLTTDLIQRRPDLRKAYFEVQAADQRIAAAIADRFPKFSLSISVDTSAPNLQALFNNWLATLAGNLVLPIIDGQRRVAEVERHQALAKMALNNYATHLLTAVQEIEDALIQQQQQQQLVISLAQQLIFSQHASAQIKLAYSNGAENFLRLLSINLSQQDLQRDQLRAQRQLIEYHIALYRALAGAISLTYYPDT
jgi:NodT family efflux transporter outer membrane factor (OMF) lipoprotein